MRCLKCGSEWVVKSTVRTWKDGLTHEWLCKKCGSTKISREEGEMKGTCGNCGRKDMTVQKLNGTQYCGTCAATYYKHKAGEERDKAMAEKAATLGSKKAPPLPARAAEPVAIPKNEPAAAVKASFKADAASVTKYPPAPSNGNGLFPPLTLTFEERDAALVDFIEEDATKHRRTPDQHILWILEQHYESLLHTS